MGRNAKADMMAPQSDQITTKLLPKAYTQLQQVIPLRTQRLTKSAGCCDEDVDLPRFNLLKSPQRNSGPLGHFFLSQRAF